VPLSTPALEPLLRLALLPGVGPGRLATLIGRFGSADRVLAASPGEVQSVAGIGAELARRLRGATEPAACERARAAIAAIQRVGAVAITPDDLLYPDAFRTLMDPPYLLFVAGDLSLLDTSGFAVVGTRQPTRYGHSAASSLSAALTAAGYTIISGMAKGIDAAAHTAALDAGGGTVGVLGHGIDRIYPAENRGLFLRMRENGLLISEFVPGEQPRAGNFPRRNRLIAALSHGVLVVEMGSRSGAQHTVTFALEQGKEIFAVPGPIGSVVSEGTNQLLKEGARVVTSVDDILEELEGVGRLSLPSRRNPTVPPVRSTSGGASVTPAPAAAPRDLPPEEARVLSALGAVTRHVDDLAADAGLATSTVLAALLGLELRGLVEALPGKQFRRS
jgi:DNA processing protein